MKKEWQEAFKDGFQNPGAPLTPGEATLLRRAPRAGPRVVLVETEMSTDPAQMGELTHSPTAFGADEDVVDAEIID